jgi:hypothetical protein
MAFTSSFSKRVKDEARPFAQYEDAITMARVIAVMIMVARTALKADLSLTNPSFLWYLLDVDIHDFYLYVKA